MKPEALPRIPDPLPYFVFSCSLLALITWWLL